MKKVTTDEFIKRIDKIFKGKYDTSKVVYVNSKTKVTLICPEHGEFTATPNHLLEGHGCPHCVNRYMNSKGFIEKAHKVHGNKYDYSKVNYINTKTLVSIICPEHGEFLQVPYSHLQGVGCPKCNGGVKMNQEEFIQRANEIHNSFYDYNQVDYINAKTKIKIICPKHGEFYQIPYQHLKGQGCPKCKSSKMENMVINVLQKENIRFIFQAHIGNLGLKTLDFYLPEYKCVIECQGEQHFIDTKFGSNLSYAKDRIEIDSEKYNECQLNGLNVFYFTNPNYFHVSNVDINIPFYANKNLYSDLHALIQEILKLPKHVIHDKWFDVRGYVFKEIPNAIETNHGYQYKNRILFLYDSTSDNFVKSNWVKYYRNRGIKTKFLDYQTYENLTIFIDWLKNS